MRFHLTQIGGPALPSGQVDRDHGEDEAGDRRIVLEDLEDMS